MPRSSSTSVENNFSKGLITEATAMNYPENSVVETDNCVYTNNGRVIRRYGIDFETTYSLSTFSTMSIMASAGTPSDYYNSVVMVEYNWTTVDNNGAISFLVQQIGDRLVFFSITDDNNYSANRKSFSVDLDSYLITVPGGNVGQYTAARECSFSSGFGYLFVTHPLCSPFYVSYNSTTDAITVTAITISVRDFERLSDSLRIDERPASLTDAHTYNLYNQGWYISAVPNGGGAASNVITQWDTARTDFPSNVDVWWLYKDADDEFNTANIDKFAIGNSPAPNGHYIWNAFLSDRSSISGIGTVSEFTAGDYRPSVTAFFSGRVWYAGTDATGYSSRIYFSKVVETVNDFGVCYQIADPTSETDADLLPTDGGVIVIPDVERVVSLVNAQDALYVFCTNGIWKIAGPNGVFAANDYSITKISTIPVIAKNSIVVAEGVPFWWDKSGIYTIQFDPNSGKETVANLTATTIQTVINEIENDNLAYVKGAYNSINKTLHYVYRSTTTTNLLENYNYDKLLVLNLVTQSFSIMTIQDGTPKVAGVMFSNQSNNDALINVEGSSIVKFITVGAIGSLGVMAYTISQFNNSNYLDWYTYDGVGIDYESYFITGYRVRGELLRKYQANYVTVMTQQETNASCFIQGVWDYSNDPLYGKFTTSQQVFRENTHRDYSRRKLRIRGSGYSLQFKFYSESGKPFTLIGWSSFESAGNVP